MRLEEVAELASSRVFLASESLVFLVGSTVLKTVPWPKVSPSVSEEEEGVAFKEASRLPVSLSSSLYEKVESSWSVVGSPAGERKSEGSEPVRRFSNCSSKGEHE